MPIAKMKIAGTVYFMGGYRYAIFSLV